MSLKADDTKDHWHPVWASVPIETEPEPSKYDLVVVLLALNPIRVYESIILSGTAGTEYGRLPWRALSVLGGHALNAASEVAIRLRSVSSCRTCRPPWVTTWILQMTVCLRDGKEAVEQLKAIYPQRL